MRMSCDLNIVESKIEYLGLSKNISEIIRYGSPFIYSNRKEALVGYPSYDYPDLFELGYFEFDTIEEEHDFKALFKRFLIEMSGSYGRSYAPPVHYSIDIERSLNIH